MVVIEDVDLIAEDRGMHPGQHPLLFQLLNEMHGLAEDADVVFVLTTNRADLLEPTLAARSARIDQAVELTLPDAAARRQLFELYRGELTVDESRLDDLLERTGGVTASFLKALLRRAAVLSAAATSEVTVGLNITADQLDAALTELQDTRNAMTRVLLGSPAVEMPGSDQSEATDCGLGGGRSGGGVVRSAAAREPDYAIPAGVLATYRPMSSSPKTTTPTPQQLQ